MLSCIILIMLTSEFLINKLIQFWVTSLISMLLHKSSREKVQNISVLKIINWLVQFLLYFPKQFVLFKHIHQHYLNFVIFI